MCGIVAVIGGMFKKEVTTFHDLLVVDSLRGPHSTGVYVVRGDEDHLVKKALLPHELMHFPQFKRAFDKLPDLCIGHNRWATVGDVNASNAHPFEADNIVGVHNGTLTNWKKLKDSGKFIVDSECLIHNIDQDGIDVVWGKLEGAATVMWWDKKAKLLNVIRNKERPMFYARQKGTNVVLFASEHWMLLSCAGRNGVTLEDLTELPVDTLLTVDVMGNIQQRAVKPYVKPVVSYSVTARPSGQGPYKEGERIEFEVVAVHHSANRDASLRVECKTPTGNPVNVWLNPRSAREFDLIQLMGDSPFTFTGVVSFSNSYVTSVKADSVVELIQLDDGTDEEEMCECCGLFESVDDISDKTVHGINVRVCKSCYQME